MKNPIPSRQKRAWRSALAGLGLLTLSPAPAAWAAPGQLARQEPAVVPCALTVRQQPLAEVLASIEQQTGYRFLYVDQANRLGRRISVEAPHSNLVFVDLVEGARARSSELLPYLKEHGVLATGLYRLRFATHLDVDAEDVDRAIEAIRGFFLR